MSGYLDTEIHLVFELVSITSVAILARVRIYRTLDILSIFGYSLIQIEVDTAIFDLDLALVAIANRAQQSQYPKILPIGSTYMYVGGAEPTYETLEDTYYLQEVGQLDWRPDGYDIRTGPNYHLSIELYYVAEAYKAAHPEPWPEDHPDNRYPEHIPDGDGNVARHAHSLQISSSYEDIIYSEWDYTISAGYSICMLPIQWLWLHQQGADNLEIELDLSAYSPLDSGDLQFYAEGYPGYRGAYAASSEYGSLVHGNTVSIPGGSKTVYLITLPEAYDRKYRYLDEQPAEDVPTHGPFIPIISLINDTPSPQIGTWREHPKVASNLVVNGAYLLVNNKRLRVKQWRI